MLRQGPDLLVRRLETSGPLPGEDRKALREVPLQLRQLDARQVLYQAGEAARQAYLVIDGFGARFRAFEDGGRQITAYLVPGDLDDPLGSLHARRHHGLMALTPVLVGTLDGAALREVARRHPAVMDALCRAVLLENAMLAEWMANIGQRPTDRRIAHLLCELLVRLEDVGMVADNSFVLPVSQIDIADTVGISAVHANRVIQQLKAERLIELDRRILTVPDPAALMAFAGFDVAYLRPGG